MMNLALRQWRETFAQKPVDALDHLIRGLVPLGTASQLSLGELFSLSFERGDSKFDAIVRAWLDSQILKPIPNGMMPGRWSTLLAEFFRAIADWRLAETGDLLRQRHQDIRLWLRGLYEGLDRDPEGTYLLALAYHQNDQHFSPLWRRLILAEEMSERPWRNIGMLGFRKMPNAHGQPAADVPDGLLCALVELAEKSGMKQSVWQQTIRSLFAAYPSSEGYWVKKFTEIVASSRMQITNLHGWLVPILPQWQSFNEHQSNPNMGDRGLPSYGEMMDWKQQIEKNPKLSETPEFNRYLERYRIYTRATGQTHYLVRTFNSIAVVVARKLRYRSNWALGLMKEAMDYEPLNPRNWTSYAQVLKAANRTNDALNILWHARYHFPWHSFAHSDLGRLLCAMGDLTTSEAVLREAVALFPNDNVCESSLAETLKAIKNKGGAKQEMEQRQAENMIPVERLGRSMIALWQAERANDTTERNRLCDLALKLLDVPEKQMGELLSGFVETRGLIFIARGEVETALEYYSDQIERLGRGGWIGIRLGELRARIMLGRTGNTEAESLFTSGHARFVFHVAEVICRLAQNDAAQQTLAHLLKELYPRAAKMAVAETYDLDNEDEKADQTLLAQNSREMVAQFIHARWFQPAGVHSKDDLNNSAIIQLVTTEILKTKRDTLDLITTVAPALAA